MFCARYYLEGRFTCKLCLIFWFAPIICNAARACTARVRVWSCVGSYRVWMKAIEVIEQLPMGACHGISNCSSSLMLSVILVHNPPQQQHEHWKLYVDKSRGNFLSHMPASTTKTRSEAELLWERQRKKWPAMRWKFLLSRTKNKIKCLPYANAIQVDGGVAISLAYTTYRFTSWSVGRRLGGMEITIDGLSTYNQKGRERETNRSIYLPARLPTQQRQQLVYQFDALHGISSQRLVGCWCCRVYVVTFVFRPMS